jgi:exosortase
MFSKIFPTLRSLSLSQRWLLVGGMASALALIWACWPTLAIMAARWWNDPRYSHGLVVPPFALFLLWWQRGRAQWEEFQPHWGGLVLLLVGLGLHLLGSYIYLQWLMGIALLPCLAGLSVLLGGWAALRWTWPAIAFLVFMVPLPYHVEIALAHPLQRLATVTSTYALQTFGFVAVAEGNQIRMGRSRPLSVEEACSGLSMLMSFFFLATAAVVLFRRPWYMQLLILLSAAPIAVIANVIRITATGVLHKTVGQEAADFVFHELAGYLMPLLAAGMLWLELRLAAKVLVRVPVQNEARRRLVVPGLHGFKRGVGISPPRQA